MYPTWPRRAGALLSASALLAALLSAVGTAPVVAQPSCDGMPATITDNDGNDFDPTVGDIVGGDGPDVIVGTNGNNKIFGHGGRDRICGGLGEDEIHGGGGNDRLFGGSDDDSILGEDGHDDLFGFAGNDAISGGKGRDFARGGDGDDEIYGQAQNDELEGNGGRDFIRGGPDDDDLDGGPADDDCLQGAGSGAVRRCEKADLKVTVSCPAHGGPGITTCQVKVKNLGPDGSSYSLDLEEATVEVSPNCSAAGWSEDGIGFPPLASGATRTRSFGLDCEGEGGSNRFEARVDADARDPRPGNDEDEAIIDFG